MMLKIHSGSIDILNRDLGVGLPAMALNPSELARAWEPGPHLQADRARTMLLMR